MSLVLLQNEEWCVMQARSGWAVVRVEGYEEEEGDKEDEEDKKKGSVDTVHLFVHFKK